MYSNNAAQEQSEKKRMRCKKKPDLEFLPKHNTSHAVALKPYIKELLRIFLAPAL